MVYMVKASEIVSSGSSSLKAIASDDRVHHHDRIKQSTNMDSSSFLITFILINSLLLSHTYSMVMATDEAFSTSKYKLKVVSKRTSRKSPPSPRRNPPIRVKPIPPPPAIKI
ncbi:hypothetical protein OWV82_007663 [Melia azedarach]|uniref:Uncharacterized protein n=1 Tax=Melia azedarach TaxID=155640 RepID=A0ACC1Y8Z1_MELAZ|nr:hypothetical protein OWV82_007663 [Melia azedarach]